MAAFTDYKALDFSGLDKSINSIAQRQQLSKLGQGIDGSPEGFAKAGQSLLALGDIGGATNMFALSEKARERSLTEGLTRSSPFNTTSANTPRSPVAPAARALGTPVVAAPRQGVHVAENEDDVQRLERATGMVTTDADKQAIVKTVYGEAANEPAVGQQAVAAVIRNRANQSGLAPADVVLQRNQFEPWNTEAGRARMNGIGQRRFDQIAGTVAPVIDQGLDPTGGATHFYAPRAQAALGRNTPAWDNGTGSDIGNHRFFQLGYGQGGGTPAASPQAIIASAPQEGAAPVQTAQAPAQGGAPVQPVPGDDPVRLRQEAQFYAQTNPEAARQLNARADAAERSGGVQTAQAAPQSGAPVADMPAQGAAPAQDQPGGFRLPGTPTLPPNDPVPGTSTADLLAIAANPKHPHHALALKVYNDRQAWTSDNAPDQREKKRLETLKTAAEVTKLERENAGKGYRSLVTPEERAQWGVPPDYNGAVQIDRDNQLHFPGKPTTEVNISGEKSYDQTTGKALAERFGEIQKSGNDAGKTLGTINMMEAQMNDPNFRSGFGAERGLMLNRALVALGVKDPKSTSATEVFQSLSNQLILDAAGGSLGANISNGDREFIASTAASLANTPEGNKQLLDMRRKIAGREQEVAKLARQYAARNKGRLDAGFEDELAKFREGNPLFVKPDAPTTPAAPPPSTAADHLRANPALRGAFDEKYGAGAAAKILGQ